MRTPARITMNYVRTETISGDPHTRARTHAVVVVIRRCVPGFQNDELRARYARCCFVIRMTVPPFTSSVSLPPDQLTEITVCLIWYGYCIYRRRWNIYLKRIQCQPVSRSNLLVDLVKTWIIFNSFHSIVFSKTRGHCTYVWANSSNFFFL